MNEYGKDYGAQGDQTPGREELGISTGLMEWFQSAPWVIEGRLVTRNDRMKQEHGSLSGYQVELPSRRWLVQQVSQPENTEQCPPDALGPDRPAEPPRRE